jgi:hypothetical protein
MDQVESLLKTEEFHQRIREFIKANLRAYIPGFETADSVKEMPNDVEVAYSRPPKPNASDYDNQVADLERRVARAKQVHTCEHRRCLVPSKNRDFVCKRRALFEWSEEDYSMESGEWGMKHLYEYLNGWVPALTINVRCNNNGKLLTNGRDTNNIAFYITNYQTKKQG